MSQKKEVEEKNKIKSSQIKMLFDLDWQICSN